jgi:N4-gp56 family major capsid protein
MALSYTAVGVDQLTKTQPSAAATSNFLTASVWNKILHEKTQNKRFWKAMIGKDKGGEGSIDSDLSNFPIVEKTDLKKDSGDTIVMGLVKQPRNADESTITYMNYGKTGSYQLVDSEAKPTFYYLHVPVALYRDAIASVSGMSKQRSPYDQRQIAVDMVSTQMAKWLDDGIFTTFYSGYSPNVWRQQSLTGVAHPNNVYGKNKSAITDVDTTDVIDSDLLERLGTFAKVNNVSPVSIEGDETYGLIVHPYGMKTLRADSLVKDAWAFALPSGKANPIFTRASGQRYANIYVMEDNRISTAKTYAVAASADAIGTISAPTLGSGITSTDVRMNILIGANAIARGWAQETTMAQRTETDYGMINGTAAIVIYGDRRADYALAESATTTTYNQSSAIVYSHSPNPNSNVSSIGM